MTGGIFSVKIILMNDEFFLRRCLDLAAKGRGLTGINPMVGALLVRDGSVIAEGVHEAFGKAHAERQLLEKFDQEMRSTDTLYVNLEPCVHTNKKTPPCAQFLVERGVKRVVYGMKDPNPDVSGKGIEYLNKNGVQTFGPILEQECKRFNRGFLSLQTKGRPWITLKQAVTSDGRHCNADRSFLKITDEEQDEWSHRFLRARHDAILVGVGTVVIDNPRLTTRLVEGPPPLTRIILDRTLRTPPSASAVGRETIIIVGEGVAAEKRKPFEEAGARVLQVASVSRGFVWADLWKALAVPVGDFHGIASVLVEGGGETWSAFRSAGLLDEEVTLVGG